MAATGTPPNGQIFVITGTSGSGKSHAAEQLRARLPESRFEVHDFDEIGVGEGADKSWRIAATKRFLSYTGASERALVLCGTIVPSELQDAGFNGDVFIGHLEVQEDVLRQRLESRGLSSDMIKKQLNFGRAIQRECERAGATMFNNLGVFPTESIQNWVADKSGVAAARSDAALRGVDRNWVDGVDGTPLRMFHATRSVEPFTENEFRIPAHGSLYFTTDREYAKGFLDPMDMGAVDWTPASGSEPGLFEVNLSVKNPCVLDGENNAHFEMFTQYGFSPERMKADGYDAAILKFADGHMDVAIFDPSQISAAPKPNVSLSLPGVGMEKQLGPEIGSR